jgi:hypothetical protein
MPNQHDDDDADWIQFHDDPPAVQTKEKKQQTALEQIEEQLQIAYKALAAAEEAARKGKVQFTFSPGGGLEGTFYGTSGEWDGIWNSSSLNC